MAASAKKKASSKGLGRGLDALLGDAPSARASSKDKPDQELVPAGPRRELPIEFLSPNPEQPRRVFDQDAIDELAGSVAARGLLQPILVRPTGKDAYEIVAGERRWRAAQKAKLHTVPVIIRELTDQETAEIALIENVQRVDLNPVEEARAYHRLADHYQRTQDDIAKAVGKSRSHVANIMRLTGLPDGVLDALGAGEISMGHARALLSVKNPEAACKRVIADDMSVRDVEALARAHSAKGDRNGSTGSGASSPQTANKKPASPKDADTRALERDLSAILGLDVAITHSKKGAGQITVDYQNLDQLDDLCRRLMGAGV